MRDVTAPRQRLLVVEDDKAIRELLAERLSRYEAVFCASQSECYERLQSTEFDVVLLDLRLPKKPTDMQPANQVGIDILKQIRKRGLTQRGSAMQLPVVVMTAHGDQRLTAEVLVSYGANDYLAKPFETDLEHKVDRAISGGGALKPSANAVGTTIRIFFHATDPVVCIESIAYKGANHALLAMLRDVHMKSLLALRLYENFDKVPGEALARKLGIEGATVRKRVHRFRCQISRDFRVKLGRVIDDNDVIENQREWNGYRFNPRMVQICAWDQLPDGGSVKPRK